MNAARLLIVTLMVLSGTAGAQQLSPPPRIWDVALGTHVGDLPADEFVDPACGSNGGPPLLFLENFAAFARCAKDAATGLYEVTFIYEDELEYTARAFRDPVRAAQLAATQVLGQPAILSFLIDDAGLVQGYRIFTDPRAEEAVRRNAYNVATALRGRVGRDDWNCVDLPLADGETPIVRTAIKQRCDKVADGRRMTAESRYYYKPGQSYIDPRTNQVMVNAFESSARLEVVSIAPVSRVAVTRSGSGAAQVPQFPPGDPRAAFVAGTSASCPGCDLAGFSFKRRDLAGADLAGANLEGASFYRANLRRANLAGANLREANLNRANITFADARGANFIGAMLFEIDAARADFGAANLSDALMGKARLTLANFRAAALDYVDLGEARMNDAILAGATLKEAYLRQAVLFRADLRASIIDGADMVEASLRGANLAGAKLRGADLTKAELADADLTNADFGDARLLMANMQGVIQNGTNFAGAVMPDNQRR